MRPLSGLQETRVAFSSPVATNGSSSECKTFMASSFRALNSSAGISSPSATDGGCSSRARQPVVPPPLQGSPINQVTSSSWVRAVSTVPGLSHSLQPHAHIGELRSPQPPLDLPRGWLPGPARRCAVDDSDVMTKSWAPTETRKDVSLPTARTRGLLPLPCIGDRTWEAQLQPCLLPCQLMLPQEQVDTL